MNLKRRKLLKLVFFGSVAAMFSSVLSRFFEGRGGAEFKNFLVREEGRKLVFYDREGKRVFTISEEGMEVG